MKQNLTIPKGIKKRLKILWYVWLVISVLHIVVAYFGVSWVVTTISAYTILSWLGYLGIKYLRKGTLKYNLLAAWFSLVISLLAADLSLRYVFKKNLHYLELNGQHLYVAKARQQRLFRLLAWIFPQMADLRLATLKPNTEKWENKAEFTYLHQYNALGLRGKLPDAENNKDVWVGLGDSFTEGVGAPVDSTWVQLLQDCLNTVDTDVTCINAGISGNDPCGSYVILESLLNYKPKVVLLAVNATDVDDLATYGGMERFTPSPYFYQNASPWWEPLYACSFIVRALVHSTTAIDYNLRNDHERKEAEQKGIQLLYNVIANKYTELAETHNFKLVVVFFPMLHEVENHKQYLQPIISKLEKTTRVKIVDLLPEIESELAKNTLGVNKIYWQIDGHPNSLGYRYYANIIYNTLKGDSLNR